MSEVTQNETAGQNPQETVNEVPVVQVLREKRTRRGAVKRYDVVSIGKGHEDALADIREGHYHVLDPAGRKLDRVRVSYRTVQDIERI